MAMAASSFMPSTMPFDHFDPQNTPNTPASQEIMYYPHHQHHQQHHLPGGGPFPPSHQPPLVLSDYGMHNHDTPSSMDDQFSPATQNDNGKRPSLSAAPGSSRKRPRRESDFDPDASIDANSPQDTFDPKEGKPKATRGARYVPVLASPLPTHFFNKIRACTVCRRLKMKCVTLPGLTDGPCKRCRYPTSPAFPTRSSLSLGQAGNHVCVFEESNRGKRSSK